LSRPVGVGVFVVVVVVELELIVLKNLKSSYQSKKKCPTQLLKTKIIKSNQYSIASKIVIFLKRELPESHVLSMNRVHPV
jgi:hypothetical protein